MANLEQMEREAADFYSTLEASKDRFREFLGAMPYHYRQPVDTQVQLFFHAPVANRAYATEAVWEKLGARIKGEGLDVPNGDAAERVYDVTETTYLESHSGDALLWQYDQEKDSELLAEIGTYSRDAEESTEDFILRVANEMTAARLEGESEDYQNIVALGAAYIALERLGLDAEDTVGLPFIMAEYNIDGDNIRELLEDVRKSSMELIDPIATKIREARRSQEQEQAETHTVQKETQAEAQEKPSSQSGGGDTAQNEKTRKRYGAPEEREADLFRLLDPLATFDLDFSSIDYTADCRTTSGKREVFRRNLAAIAVLKRLEKYGTAPTDEERKLLQSFSGFGGLSEVFDPLNVNWQPEYKALQAALTNKEYASAKNTVLDAFYTPPEVSAAIYQGLEQIGFKGGNILEPSCGIGNFFATMPEEMKESSHTVGIEIDGLSSRIARALYEEEGIALHNQGFEENRFADGSFDLAIGNVPFGETHIYTDPKYAAQGPLVHDYFLQKMLDSVRPGGLAVAITSSGTMDKQSSRIREELYKKAELVTAMRLPNSTFENAGTSVSTDILVFKKREKELEKIDGYDPEKRDNIDEDKEWLVIDPYARPERLGISGVRPGERLPLNSYYRHHIDQMLGKPSMRTGRHGKELAVLLDKEEAVGDKIQRVFQKAAEAQQAAVYTPLEEPLPVPEQSNKPKQREMGYFIDGGDLVFVDEYGKTQNPELSEQDKQRVISAIHLRDVGHRLLGLQAKGAKDEDIRAEQETLENLYEAHIKKFGHFLKDKNFKNAFSADPGYPFVLSLEVTDEKGNFLRKADLFHERTILPDVQPEFAETAKDALIISMQERGEVDLDYMASLTDIEKEKIIQELEYTDIFYDEESRSYIQADEYLSGNIREKLNQQEKILQDIAWSEGRLLAKELYPDYLEATSLLHQPPFEARDAWDEGLFKLAEGSAPFLVDGQPFGNRKEAIKTYLQAADIEHHPERMNAIVQSVCYVCKNTFGGYIVYLPETLQKNPDLGIAFFLHEKMNSLQRNRGIGYNYELMPGMAAVHDIMNAFGEYLARTGQAHEGFPMANAEAALYDPALQMEAFRYLRYEQERILQDGVIHTPLLQDNPDAWDDLRAQIIQQEEEKFGKDNLELESFRLRRQRAEKNKAALLEVMPEKVPIADISLELSMPMFGSDTLRPLIYKFFEDKFKMDIDTFATLGYNPMDSKWAMERVKGGSSHWRTAQMEAVSTESKDTLDIFLSCLNQTQLKPSKSKRDKEGIEYDEVKELRKLELLQKELNKDFRNWILNGAERSSRVAEYYNTYNNNIRPREYDGSNLRFQGMNNTVHLMSHQKDAIAHHLFGGNALFAHCVGAGKTYEMIAAVMESKRMGLSHKAMLVVPNNLVEQMGKDFAHLYPRAKILVAGEKDMKKGKRERFISRIATQNWDAVVIAQSQFETIKLSMERQKRYIKEDIQKLEDYLEELREEKGDEEKDLTIKRVVSMIKRYEQRLEKYTKEIEKNKMDGLAFEELGIDKLVVDEAHMYKNLPFTTRYSNLGGIGNTDFVAKTWDLYTKTRYINEITDEKGLIFATGTPVSNSISEFYTMLRYLSPSLLKDQDMEHFDKFVGNFVDIRTDWEVKPEGKGLQLKTSLASFKNFPELRNIYKMVADIRTADMIERIGIPNAVYHADVAPASDFQKEVLDELAERGDAIRDGKPMCLVDEETGEKITDGFLKIVNDGKKISLEEQLYKRMRIETGEGESFRIYQHKAGDDPNSKTNRCVRNILKMYKDYDAAKGTQLVFCDDSTSTGVGKGKFNVYDNLRAKLIAQGIPKEEIAIVQEYKKDDLEKKVFGPMREGKIRVLIGNTQGLGTGVNVQKLLCATHDLSIPWRPADMDQRLGRILRPGNQNKEVHVFRYITEGTLDAWQWQKLEQKQKAFSQMMSSKNPARTIENIDTLARVYADYMGKSMDDPELKLLNKKEDELAGYKLLLEAYSNKQATYADYLKKGPKKAEELEDNISALMADKLTLKENTVLGTEAKFSIKLNDKIITDPKEAGTVIHEAAKGGRKEQQSFRGEWKGMRLFLTTDEETKLPVLTVRGKRFHKVAINPNPVKMAKSLESIAPAIDKRINEMQVKLKEANEKIADAKDAVGKPFPYAEHIERLEAEIKSLNEKIYAQGQKKKEGAVTIGKDLPKDSKEAEVHASVVPAATKKATRAVAR